MKNGGCMKSKIDTPIGQIILEIRGCLAIFNHPDFNRLDTTFIMNQITRSKTLIKEYENTKPSSTSLVQRSWLRDGYYDYIDLKNKLKVIGEL